MSVLLSIPSIEMCSGLPANPVKTERTPDRGKTCFFAHAGTVASIPFSGERSPYEVWSLFGAPGSWPRPAPEEGTGFACTGHLALGPNPANAGHARPLKSQPSAHRWRGCGRAPLTLHPVYAIQGTANGDKLRDLAGSLGPLESRLSRLRWLPVFGAQSCVTAVQQGRRWRQPCAARRERLPASGGEWRTEAFGPCAHPPLPRLPRPQNRALVSTQDPVPNDSEATSGSRLTADVARDKQEGQAQCP
jgi:hypothetical protein